MEKEEFFLLLSFFLNLIKKQTEEKSEKNER